MQQLNLEEATNRNLMPKASILTIIAHDLLEFLAYFHEKGLVHCDIKPANIIFQSLDDGFIPKMCDFGETTALQNIKNVDIICGSPFFFPPEVRERKRGYNQGVDIWALGLVLYILATGKPFDHPSYGMLRSQRQTARQLLQHYIFTNPRALNLVQIPNQNAGELGLQVQQQNNMLVSRRVGQQGQRGLQFTLVPLQQQVPQAVRYQQEQQQLQQQEFGRQVADFIAQLS
ncbi:MAG: hypothetical protein EZS28_032607, partial [Streblomastix strix]